MHSSFLNDNTYFHTEEQKRCNSWSFRKKRKTKYVYFILVLSILILMLFIFTGCADESEITKETCKNQNKVLVSKKVLNMRTGNYYIKNECK